MIKAYKLDRSILQILVVILAIALIGFTPSRLLAQDDEFGDFDEFGDDEFGDDEFGDDEFGDDEFGDDDELGDVGFGDDFGDDDSAAATPGHKPSVYNPFDRTKDPFLPMVGQKPKMSKRPTTPKPTSGPQRIPEPVVPEVELSILCVVGNAGKRLALVDFQGSITEMGESDEVEGAFKIMSIKEDAVEIYSYRTRRRKTFKIGG